MARWMILVVAAFAAVFAVTVIVSGEPQFLIPAGILALILIGAALFHRTLGRLQLRRHGRDALAVWDDGDDPIPSTAHVPDDTRPTGDTPQLHDEINPHDIPTWDQKTRKAAEKLAQAGWSRETRGNVRTPRS